MTDILKWIFMFVWGPVVGIGLAVFLLVWTLPREFFKSMKHRRQRKALLTKPVYTLPIQNLIDQVKEENGKKSKSKAVDSDWSSA